MGEVERERGVGKGGEGERGEGGRRGRETELAEEMVRFFIYQRDRDRKENCAQLGGGGRGRWGERWSRSREYDFYCLR